MGLVAGLRPKHQKLILRCYPAGKSSEKKPNNAELSYLLYYATTRRTKLEKVGVFLEKKTAVDTNRVKTGNTQVTLDIIAELIENCSENLGVFADNVINILRMVLATKDLALCQHALRVFGVFCSRLNSTLVGDKAFVSHLSELVNRFTELGSNPQKPNENEWRIVSLVACRYVASCLRYSSSFDKVVIQKAVSLILSSVTGHFNESALISRMKSHVSLENVKTAVTEVNYNDLSVEEEALNSLKALFNTDSPSQLRQATRAVGNYVTKAPVDQGWSDALIEIIASWTPVQLRYVILESMITEAIESPKLGQQKTLIDKISALLSSSVVMVGLSVRDVVSRLLEQQDKLLGAQGSEALVESYAACIQSLAKHIIYKDQISDMIDESLLVFSESYLALLEKDNGNPEKMVLSTKSVVRDITGILSVARSNDVERPHCSLSVWNKLCSVIAFEHVEPAKRVAIQKLWLDLLVKFLEWDFTSSTEAKQPDYHSYITGTNQHNPLAHLFSVVDRISQQGALFADLARLITLLVREFGVNALYNGLGFFFEWHTELAAGAPQAQVARDNLSLVFLSAGATELQLPELLKEVSAKVASRKASGMWLDELDAFVVAGSDTTSSPVFSRSNLVTLFSPNAEAHKWLLSSIDSSAKTDISPLMKPSKVPTLLSMSAQSSFLHLGQDSVHAASVSNKNIDDALDRTAGSDDRNDTFDRNNDTQSLISVAFSWAAHSTAASRQVRAPGVRDLRKAVSGDVLRRYDGGSVQDAKAGLASMVAGLEFDEDSALVSV